MFSEPRITITMEHIKRYKVFQDLVEKRITGIKAAQITGLTNVHISRIKKRFAQEGFTALVRKSPARPPNLKLSPAEEGKIISLRKNTYLELNISHFNEKLAEIHGIKYSYPTIRTLLIRNSLYQPAKRKKVYRSRRRMPKAGMLVQMDSSLHPWLGPARRKAWLIAASDDASGEVLAAKFFHSDNVFNNMSVIRGIIEQKGVFMALYVDKASHFKTTRRGGLHREINPEQDDTQIQRALGELGITLITANSPQAKGRIERLFGTFQDRLVNELKLAGIGDYDSANEFLEKFFIADYNARFAREVSAAAFMPPDGVRDLDTVFCSKASRRVNNDNTVQFGGRTIQIPPSAWHLSFARRRVEVCSLEGEKLIITYNGRIIHKTLLPENPKTAEREKKSEKLMNLREYFNFPRKKSRPAANHPWRRFRFGKGLTFQKYNSLTS